MPELFFDWDEVGKLLYDASTMVGELRGGDKEPAITTAEEMPDWLCPEALVITWEALDAA